MTKATPLQKKLARLSDLLASKGRLLVAYSGGVDSGLLMLMAAKTLGTGAAAVIVDSPTVPREDIRRARAEARKARIRLDVIKYDVLSNEHFVSNDALRCYHCRKGMMRLLKGHAKGLGIDTVATGANADDPDDYRPGLRAEKEEGIWQPLRECGLTKDEIRAALKGMGVKWSGMPASPCLSSRIAYGEAVTKTRLRAIESAEAMLQRKGLKVVRVRSHGDVARLELGPAEMKEFLNVASKWPSISKAVKRLGWKYVALDLEGFSSGSMNRSLGKRK